MQTAFGEPSFSLPQLQIYSFTLDLHIELQTYISNSPPNCQGQGEGGSAPAAGHTLCTVPCNPSFCHGDPGGPEQVSLHPARRPRPVVSLLCFSSRCVWRELTAGSVVS